MIHMDQMIVRESREVLSKHARSFRWASWFLPEDCRDDAAVVYALCRLIDDIADLAEDENVARVELNKLRRELRAEEAARPLVAAFREVAARRNMSLEFADQLIEGVLSDLRTVRVKDDDEFLRYCYRVAGTVGLMMCGVLGVDERTALPHAIDLGVAMQITNICRDVLEDSQNDRVYLPESRLRAAGTSQEEILAGTADPNAVSKVVADLLQLADVYYRSADHGMRYIPARSRFAIVVAARLYRAIGLKLKSRGANPMNGRTWIPWYGKIRWTVIAAVDYLSPEVSGSAHHPGHDATLHIPLQGLPGAGE